jgi:hypothetical protein
MDRSRVTELHFISHLANLPSIAQRGILSNRLAESIPHRSVAAEEIQERRRFKRVPGGRLVHEYANVYFDARNPMMSKRREQRKELVVIRISPAALDLPGAVIADGNAASDVTRFEVSPQGLEILDEERVYAEWWTDQDIVAHTEKKRQRCAEVLVPDMIPPSYILGYYVYDINAQRVCQQAMPGLEAVVNRYVFLY